MASASLVSTSKVSGTKVNQIWMDEWDVISEAIEKPKEYLEYNTPPLALVIAMQEAGKQSHEIYETLVGAGKMHGRIDIVPVITTEHQTQAATIYDYFAKKHTFRRIKGEYISEYMLALDDLCENRKRIDLESVKILVTLPRFYQQNLELERIMKVAKSIDKKKTVILHPFEHELEFVDCVNLTNKNSDNFHYFWKTKDENLVRFTIKKSDISNSVWKLLSKHGKIMVKSNYPGVSNIQGYDFFVYTLGLETEIDLI